MHSSSRPPPEAFISSPSTTLEAVAGYERMRRVAQLGVKATWVDSGRAALERAPDHDAVVLDMRLPGLNGLDASAAIRAQCDPTRPWIIAATANATEHDRSRAELALLTNEEGPPP